mmetsp:Transcript_22391/g.33087  ORF Transcript_22391/g.33087 Transcript_22391/m.33087 type:complete len:563 (+) Transcript_22391:139-1827(+)|eukprot:CAMPEP_0194215354 /NCGR_PEP_ID=MMETSP0156-20130528/17116_1 /TAXON_ID=33649 /ORGANISM="Thalassionema nitzschioides, Strain L26-B" /LENGTH=562 /DNA_ID=CAMNT_0038943853 /DNA_START=87 /DNA_END=1775 /DNA_ORIENTATION=+
MAKNFVLSLRHLSLKSDGGVGKCSSLHALEDRKSQEKVTKFNPDKGQNNKTWKQCIGMPHVMLGKRQRLDHDLSSTQKKKAKNKFRSVIPLLVKKRGRDDEVSSVSSTLEKESDEKPAMLSGEKSSFTTMNKAGIFNKSAETKVDYNNSFYNRSFYTSPFYKKSTAKIFKVKTSDSGTSSQVYNSAFYNSSTCEIFRPKSATADTSTISQNKERLQGNCFQNQNICSKSEVFPAKKFGSKNDFNQSKDTLQKNPFENRNKGSESEIFGYCNVVPNTNKSKEQKYPVECQPFAMSKEMVLQPRGGIEECKQPKRTRRQYGQDEDIFLKSELYLSTNISQSKGALQINPVENQNEDSKSEIFGLGNGNQISNSKELIKKHRFGRRNIGMPKEIVIQPKRTKRYQTTHKRKNKKKNDFPAMLVTDIEWKCSSREGTYTGEAYESPEGAIAHGRGKLCFSNGDVYTGRFRHGEMHGEKALFKSKTGFVYTGCYKHNARNGFGEQVHPNGRLYMGNFTNNLPDGFGVQYNADGSVLYCGKWENGIQIGAKQEATGPLDSISFTKDTK